MYLFKKLIQLVMFFLLGVFLIGCGAKGKYVKLSGNMTSTPKNATVYKAWQPDNVKNYLGETPFEYELNAYEYNNTDRVDIYCEYFVASKKGYKDKAIKLNTSDFDNYKHNYHFKLPEKKIHRKIRKESDTYPRKYKVKIVNIMGEIKKVLTAIEEQSSSEFRELQHKIDKDYQYSTSDTSSDAMGELNEKQLQSKLRMQKKQSLNKAKTMFNKLQIKYPDLKNSSLNNIIKQTITKFEQYSHKYDTGIEVSDLIKRVSTINVAIEDFLL